jgi:hypothetical protein
MRHKLKEKLWPAFKEDYPNPHLTQASFAGAGLLSSSG